MLGGIPSLHRRNQGCGCPTQCRLKGAQPLDEKHDYLSLPTHRLHYRIDGTQGPWLLFCNSLGTNLHMWDAQISVLSRHFRVLRYDQRGHGLSSTPSPPYTLSDLGRDVIALLDALNVEHTHICGLSIGGLTAQWLAIHAGHRINKIVVCATSTRIGTTESWVKRMDDVLKNGLLGLIKATAERWFTPRFRETKLYDVRKIFDSFVSTSVDGYVGCCAALADANLSQDIKEITSPLLAISGKDDPVCPPADLENIAAHVHIGKHLSFPGRHLFNLESPEPFNAVLLSFLS